MNTKELVDALTAMLELYDMWRTGIFTTIGVVWVEEPSAVIQARAALQRCEVLRCTGDGLTCPVGHDHP